jgi:hypothetical protein
MLRTVLDTHAVIWYIFADQGLTPFAKTSDQNLGGLTPMLLVVLDVYLKTSEVCVSPVLKLFSGNVDKFSQ